jgi:hypothetical protein
MLRKVTTGALQRWALINPPCSTPFVQKTLQIDLNLFDIPAIIRAWNQTDRFTREPETC